MVSSFIISVYVKETNPVSLLPVHKDLFKNYSILRYFLDLPDNIFNKDKKNKTNNSTTKIEFSGTKNKLITEILKLKNAESLLKEKKYRRAENSIYTMDQSCDFLKRKKTKLYLKTLYFQQKYKEYIKQFNTYPIEDDLHIQLLYINCLVKTRADNKAFELFKKIFLKNKLKPFKKLLPPKSLNVFLRKLEYDYWFEKFKYLAQKNYFSEFLKEKVYIRSSQLHHLFYAEFYYKKRRYSYVKKHLTSVKSPKLLNHKRKLLLKINLWNKNYKAIFKHLRELEDNSTLYAEVLFDGANILLTRRELDLSLAFFTKYIKYIEANKLLSNNDSKYWKALWVSAWIIYRKNDKLKAVQYFKKGMQAEIDNYRIANTYWYHRLKKTDSFSQIADYPFSYYYTKTSTLRETLYQDSLLGFITLINGKQGPLFLQLINDLKSLLKNHLIDESFAFVNWAKTTDKLTDSEKNTFKIIESILYLKKKNFYYAFEKFKRNFDGYQSFRLPKFLRSIYFPTRYKAFIETYSERNQLDKNLIFAVIWQESFFRPDVVSPAKANGLMQLLYKTARQTAAKLDLKIKKRDLYNPRINIKLGTDHLKYLLDKHDGKLHLALTSYNAGYHRSIFWLEKFGDVSADEFIEMIPFTETRNYVKNILRNYYYYKFYYGDK